MEIPKEEATLVVQLMISIPQVFKQKGTPDDLNFILSHIKQAVCHRGITTCCQKLLVSLVTPLGRFKAGFMDVAELGLLIRETLKQYQPNFISKIKEVCFTSLFMIVSYSGISLFQPPEMRPFLVNLCIEGTESQLTLRLDPRVSASE